MDLPLLQRWNAHQCLLSMTIALLPFTLTYFCSQALLKSIYAETIRLRITQFIVHSSDHEDFKYKHWIIPKGQLVAVDSRAAHTNEIVWSTGGPGDPHPINEFWAERFLVYPSDPNSGPLKLEHRGKGEIIEDLESTTDGNNPIFSVSGLAGAWVPYGGGRRQCPGRIFAKQEIILSAAIFCASFEIDFLSDERPEPDMRYYGLGGLPPTKRILCRIRHRQ